MSYCAKEDCKRCNTRLDGNENNMAEYLKECGVALIDFIRWWELLFIVVVFIVFYTLFGWFGIILAPFFHYMMATIQGGAVADIFNEYPDEKFPPNKCSAGIRNCQICNNEYSHEFNESYKVKRKWYNV